MSIERLKDKNYEKYEKYVHVYCKCGKSCYFKRDYPAICSCCGRLVYPAICSCCGRLVYPSKESEFKNKLIKEMKKR